MLHHSDTLAFRKNRPCEWPLPIVVRVAVLFLMLAIPAQKAWPNECLDKIPHVQAALNAAKDRWKDLLAVPADCSKTHVNAALALTGAANFAVTSARAISGCALGVANEIIREAQGLFMRGSSVITKCGSVP